ncbi:MAG: MarR family transcriptional regulator [Kiloniellales bacterium]
MDLTPAMQRYVLHWGEMGNRWGANRSIAQIQALLFLSDRPLPADEIAETLAIARSNVSNSLRELQGWGLVRVSHQIGERRDHFEALSDPWEMFRRIVEERKKREIDPTLAMLRDCVAEAEADGRTPDLAKERMQSMLAFLQLFDGWYAEVKSLPKATVLGLAKAGGKVAKVLGRVTG